MVEGIMLRKLDTGEELALEMVSTPYFILKSVDWGVVKSTHHSYKYVNQIGVTIVGTSLETRSVEIQGWVIADTEQEMNERKRVLNRFFNPQVAIDMMYKQYILRIIPDSTVKYGTNHTENNEVVAQFKVNATAPDPLFSESGKNRQTIASTVALFHFPLIISNNLYEGGIVFGYREPSLTANVTNSGSVPVGMRIVFKANGTVLNPRLVNVNTREFFQVDKMMVGGEEIEIVTNVGEKSIIGRINGEAFNYFRYKNLDSTWLQLQLGENIFRYGADDGLDKLEVFLYFSNKYLEVQECY